jgi:ribosomal protein L11 methyltransferase
MPFLSITLIVDARCVEALSDALMERGALSIDVADAAAGTVSEKPLFAEPGSSPAINWAQNRMAVLFADDMPIAHIIPQALQAASLPPATPYGIDTVDDQDWVRLTRDQFTPLKISPRVWVVPTWHEVVDASAINIRLDPGLAFGTGTHPTTQLVLRWLDAHLAPGSRVIDYGCGSGILAIAALKLGAAHAVGVDIDEQAIIAARDNAARNTCNAFFLGAEDSPPAAADVVLANILANPLNVLAPQLAALCLPGGHVVLSGILTTQAAEVREVYQRWFDMHTHEIDNEWAMLAGTRRAGNR